MISLRNFIISVNVINLINTTCNCSSAIMSIYELENVTRYKFLYKTLFLFNRKHSFGIL